MHYEHCTVFTESVLNFFHPFRFMKWNKMKRICFLSKRNRRKKCGILLYYWFSIFYGKPYPQFVLEHGASLTCVSMPRTIILSILLVVPRRNSTGFSLYFFSDPVEPENKMKDINKSILYQMVEIKLKQEYVGLEFVMTFSRKACIATRLLRMITSLIRNARMKFKIKFNQGSERILRSV